MSRTGVPLLAPELQPERSIAQQEIVSELRAQLKCRREGDTASPFVGIHSFRKGTRI
jgi:hypothetical protein